MRLRVLLLISLFAAALFSPLLQTASPASADGVVFLESGASLDFPAGMTFRLEAESSTPIEKVELFYTKAGLETLNLATANVESANDIEIELAVDFAADYVPPGIDIRFHWRLTDADGLEVESDAARVTWKDTRFDWDLVKTDQVAIFYYSGNDAFAQAILDSAQTTIDRLQPVYGLRQSKRVNVWVYNSKKDFSGSQAPNSQEWIAGTAYQDLRLILAVLPEGDMREVGRVIPHEISHQVLFQVTDNPFSRLPTWLDEGLAVMSQDNGYEDFPALVEQAAEEGRLFSIRALNADFPYDPADASLAYAESYSIVRFIIDRYGADALAALVQAYGDGLSDDEALIEAIGIDLDELDLAWKSEIGYQPPPEIS